MTKHTSLDLPDRLYARLADAASVAGKQPEELIIQALEDHLETLEDLKRITEYENDVRAGLITTVSLDRLSGVLALDD